MVWAWVGEGVWIAFPPLPLPCGPGGGFPGGSRARGGMGGNFSGRCSDVGEGVSDEGVWIGFPPPVVPGRVPGGGSRGESRGGAWCSEVGEGLSDEGAWIAFPPLPLLCGPGGVLRDR